MQFTVYKPTAHDEDAPPVANEHVLIICDGLGATGQNTYEINGIKRTSAYLGSRKVSEIVQKYCQEHYDEMFDAAPDPVLLAAKTRNLKEQIQTGLTEYVSEHGLANSVRGSAIRMLPTTMVAVLYKECSDHSEAIVLSAGDSRAFMLAPKQGLQQISVDDTAEGTDAYEKNTEMTNSISQDRPFHINYRYYATLPAGCVLFACTDGFFDYISCPMELEYRMELAIVSCKNPLAGNSVGEAIGAMYEKEGLKDDCTLAGAILGYSDSGYVKKMFYVQNQVTTKNYLFPFEAEKKAEKTESNKQIVRIQKTEQELRTAETALDERAASEVQKRLHQVFCKTFASESELEPPAEKTSPCGLLAESDIYQKFTKNLQRELAENAEMRNAQERICGESRNRLYAEFRRLLYEHYHWSENSTWKHVKTSGSGWQNNNGSPVESRYHYSASSFIGIFDNLFPDIPMVGDDGISEAEFQRQSAFEKSWKGFITKAQKFCEEYDRGNIAYEVFSPLRNSFETLCSDYNKLLDVRENVQKDTPPILTMDEWYAQNQDAVNRQFEQGLQSGFRKYRSSNPLYAKVYNAYQAFRKEEQKRGSIPEISPDALQKRFDAHFKANQSTYLAMLKESPDTMADFCGEEYTQVTRIREQLVEQQKSLERLKQPALEIWLKYKKTYELFASENVIGGKF